MGHQFGSKGNEMVSALHRLHHSHSLLTMDARAALEQFLIECAMIGIEDVATLRRTALQTIAHLQGTAADRGITAAEEKLQQQWYGSLAVGKPDFSVYGSDFYLAECWACWIVYSRRHLQHFLSPKSMPPCGIFSDLGVMRRIADLGCGIGYTCAALRQIFPHAEVVGTNFLATPQSAVAAQLARRFGFKLCEAIEDVGRPIDFVFASEYFEHIPGPLAHLEEIVVTLQPLAFFIASSFGARSIGHFDAYQVEGRAVSSALIPRLFNQRLRSLGYRQIKTRLWNQRPAYWKKV